MNPAPQQPPRTALPATWSGRREDFEYDIFISYRHGDGLRVADWLSRRLRHYRPPRGFHPLAPLRIYRDLERERVTPAIWSERIRPALLRSRFLIVILTESVSQTSSDGSPNWVIREISEFLGAPQGTNVMLVRDSPGTPLPAVITERFPEPGWVELQTRHVRLWRRLITRASLHDKLTALAVPALDIADTEIPRFTQLAEREKRRIAWAIAATSVILALVVSTLAGLAWIQAMAAQRSALVRSAESLVESDPTSASLLMGQLPANRPVEGALAVATSLTQVPLATILRGHELWVTSGAFSADGTYVVTASGDGTVRLWSVGGVGAPRVFTGSELAPLGSLDRELRSVAIHPDGTRVAAAGADGTVRIWRIDDPVTNQPRVLSGNGQGLRRVAFSPDGRLLVASSGGDTTRVWNIDSHNGPVIFNSAGVAVSLDGAYVVAGKSDGSAQVWRADGTGAAYLLPPATSAEPSHAQGFVDVSFSRDGRGVLVAAGRLARVWRFAEPSEPRLLSGHEGSLSSAVFSPDGTRVLTASADGTARIWTLADERGPIVLRGHTGRITKGVFSPDGTRVVTASSDETARVWRVDSPESVFTLRGHEGEVMSAAFDGDGTHVVTTGADTTVRIWDLGAPDANVAARFAPNTVRHARFDPDGRRLVTAHRDGIARVWPVGGSGPTREFRGHESGIYTAAFSADGQYIVTASSDTTARVWRIDGGEPVILRGHKDSVYTATFSPDGGRVATASDDWTAAVWSRDGGSLLRHLRGHRGHVRSAAFNRQGTELVTASDDGTSRLWQLDSDTEPRVFGRTGIDVRCAAFSPDGRRIVTGAADGTLRVWLVDRPGDPEMLWRSHQNQINTVAFSPDGTRVATASADGTARLWRLGAGREDAILRHGAAVFSAEFSDEGRRLVTTAADGSVRIWAIEWSDVLNALRSRTTTCLTDEERRRFLGENPAAALRAFDMCEAVHGRPPFRSTYLPSIGEPGS